MIEGAGFAQKGVQVCTIGLANYCVIQKMLVDYVAGGFYTAIASYNGEVVSATAFRLHRDVAEIAFVATLA